MILAESNADFPRCDEHMHAARLPQMLHLCDKGFAHPHADTSSVARLIRVGIAVYEILNGKTPHPG